MGHEINIKLLPKQIEAFEYLQDETTNELLYGGGARGGKTYFGCIWQIIRRINMPGSVGLIAREELTKLKDTTLVTFFKVLRALNLTQYFSYNGQTYIATCINGSIIYFRELKYLPSDPEFDRLGSLEITDAFIDESQQIKEKAISVLRGRFSLLTGTYENGGKWTTIPKALYTCNPRRNWIYTDFVLPHKNGLLPPERKFIKSLVDDNPYIEQSYIDNLMRSDKVTIQRLRYGNFEYDDDPSSLCDYDAICDIFTNDHVQGGIKTISSDLAMKGRDRFIVGSWNGLICHIKIDKTYTTGKEIESDLKSIMIKDCVSRSRTVVDSDGLGSYLESYLNGIKEFHGGNRPYDNDYFNLKSECAFKLAEFINNRKIKIICTKDQEERIKEELAVLKIYDIDNDTSKKRIISKEEMKELLQRSPDCLDMLLMNMIFYIKPLIRKPIIRATTCR